MISRPRRAYRSNYKIGSVSNNVTVKKFFDFFCNFFLKKQKGCPSPDSLCFIYSFVLADPIYVFFAGSGRFYAAVGCIAQGNVSDSLKVAVYT